MLTKTADSVESAVNIMIFYDDILENHYVKRVKLLNQQVEQGQQMICILSQEKGAICNFEIKNNVNMPINTLECFFKKSIFPLFSIVKLGIYFL